MDLAPTIRQAPYGETRPLEQSCLTQLSRIQHGQQRIQQRIIETSAPEPTTILAAGHVTYRIKPYSVGTGRWEFIYRGVVPAGA